MNKRTLAIGVLIIVVAIISVSALMLCFAPEEKTSVTYHGNGGVTDAGKTDITIESNIIESYNLFTNPGMIITKWNTKEDGSGITYNFGAKITDSVELYAQWEDKTLTVLTMPPLSNATITLKGDNAESVTLDVGVKASVPENAYLCISSADKITVKDDLICITYDKGSYTLKFHAKGCNIDTPVVNGNVAKISIEPRIPKAELSIYASF